MKISNEQLAQTKTRAIENFAYGLGYFAAVATLIKFGWWVWQQPW